MWPHMSPITGMSYQHHGADIFIRNKVQCYGHVRGYVSTALIMDLRSGDLAEPLVSSLQGSTTVSDIEGDSRL